ncbi:MAG: hypothetical protein HYU59_04785 [Magnetospirillum gryphiswaldense]|nr:hypothetical protein [Magnetospirillum gryphiswaldense]
MAVSSTSSSVTASAVAETIYPVMVNGYLCYSAAEVAAVKSGQSPDSVKPGAGNADKAGDSAASAAASQAQQAKALSEAQARVAQFSQLSTDAQQQYQQDQRDQDRQRGTLVDVYA